MPRERTQAISVSKLPDMLAATLPPETQDALDHPVRRQVLRILNSSDQARSAGEMAATLPGVPHSAVSYHAQVLENQGSISLAHLDREGAVVARHYVSNVIEDARVAIVLDAMRQDDG